MPNTVLEEAEKEQEALVAERFKLLLKIEDEIRTRRILDVKLEDVKAKFLSEVDDGDGIKVFAVKLSVETTEDEIFQYFNRFGKVKDVTLARNEQTGKSKCYATVNFLGLNNLEALLVKPHKINGKKIIVCRKNDSGNKKVIVSGPMVRFLTDEDIKEFFSKFGKVTSLGYGNSSEESRVVEFESSEAVNKVLNQRSYKIFNKHVTVSKPRPKNSLKLH